MELIVKARATQTVREFLGVIAEKLGGQSSQLLRLEFGEQIISDREQPLYMIGIRSGASFRVHRLDPNKALEVCPRSELRGAGESG